MSGTSEKGKDSKPIERVGTRRSASLAQQSEDAKRSKLSSPVALPDGLARSSLFTKNTTSLPQALPQSPIFGHVPSTAYKIADLRLGLLGQSVSLTGRITNVSNVRNWGTRKAVTCDFMDETGEISFTLFDAKVDTYANFLQVNQVVSIENIVVKSVDSRYLRIPKQLIEIIVNGTVTASTVAMPEIDFQFKDLVKIYGTPASDPVDFIGIVCGTNDLVQGISKDGRPYMSRVIDVTDKSKAAFTIKLWGSLAESFSYVSPKSIVMRRAKIDEFGGFKCLTVGASTLLMIDSDLQEAVEMMNWFQSEI